MEKNNLKIWGLIVVALVIIATVIFFVSQNKQIFVTEVNDSATTEPAESVQDSDQAAGITIDASPISYANALVKYADRRIQLDKDCRAYPSNVTYKDNTGIMIDNRSPKTRTVIVGTTFTIKPYGFKIVILPDIYLKSRTILVDCDQSQNVATILVQE